jgi:group I intron endonuclease
MPYIYKITNTLNNKVYIGETIRTPIERWRQHKNFQSKYYTCPILKQAFIKYGLENFKFEVIQECSDEEKYELEKKYIEEYNCIAPLGYNFKQGGLGGGFIGKKHSDETKQKISESGKKFNKENPDFYERHREKHIEALKKCNISERMKNSEAFQKAVEEGRVGGCKEDTKEKIRQGVLKYYENLDNKDKIKVNIEKHREVMTKALGKRVGQFELNGVTMIAEFSSTSEAGRQTGLNKGNIQHCARGRSKTAYGFIWKYLDKVI